MINQRQNCEKAKIPEDVQNKWQEMLDVLAQTMSVQTVMISRINAGQHEVFLSSQLPDHSNKKAVITAEYFNKLVIQKCVPLEICDIKKELFWRKTNNVSTGMNFYYGLPLIRNDGECFGSISILDFQKNSSFDSCKVLIQYFKRDIESDLALFTEEASRTSRLDETFKDIQDINNKNSVEITQPKNSMPDTIDEVENSIITLLAHFSETSFQNMLDGFLEGIIILNHQNEIIGANQTAQTLLFLQRERNGNYYFANPKREIIHSSGLISLEDLFKQKVINDLLVQDKNLGFKQLNGSIMWLRVNETQLPDIQNNLEVKVLSFQDITTKLKQKILCVSVKTSFV